MEIEKYKNLSNALDNGDSKTSVEETLKLIELGVTPLEIFSKCIEPVLAGVGDKFSRLESGILTAASIHFTPQNIQQPEIS